jgi:hypothetical protein
VCTIICGKMVVGGIIGMWLLDYFDHCGAGGAVLSRPWWKRGVVAMYGLCP